MLNFSPFRNRNNGYYHKLLSPLVGLVVLFLIFLIFSTAVNIWSKIKQARYIGQESTISVSDSAEVYANPDLALISFSVVTEAKTVAEAMNENTEKMNAVIKTVKDLGVEEEDLKTTNFNIYPRYDYTRSDVYSSGTRVLVGYEITQTLEVKIRDLTQIGQIIQQATEAGANQVGELQFTIEEEDELRKQAREEAIKKAKEKAKELAKQLGVKLVRITDFNESQLIPRSLYSSESIGLGIGGGGVPEIETGQNKIEVNVTITYEIK